MNSDSAVEAKDALGVDSADDTPGAAGREKLGADLIEDVEFGSRRVCARFEKSEDVENEGKGGTSGDVGTEPEPSSPPAAAAARFAAR